MVAALEPLRAPSERPGASWRRRLRLWWHAWEWPIVAALGLLALCLGCAGFARNAAALGEHPSCWDLLYLSLQLFVLQSGAVPGPVSWELNVARFVAPGVASYTVVQALAAIFREQAQLLRLWFVRNHVVICGLGRKGLLLAQGFCSRNETVVVIERDPENPLVGACRDAGAMVVNGDATDADVLRRARVQRARYLFAVCDDDAVNAEVALDARRVVLRRRDNPLARRWHPPLSCYVHLHDAQLYALLRAQQATLQVAGAFRLEFFNLSDAAARMLVEVCPPPPGPEPLVVIGLGPLGQAAIVRAAAQRRTHGGPAAAPLEIKAVDSDAGRKVAELQARCPWLGKACTLSPEEADVSSPAFRPESLLALAPGGAQPAVLYLCLEDDAQCWSLALSLWQRLRDRPVTIVARVTEGAGLGTLVKGVQGTVVGQAALRPFALLDQVCRPALILEGACEVIARGIHDAYVEHQRKLGFTPGTNPSMVPWRELPDDLKESNRAQADDVGRKLAAVGCGLEPLQDWDEAEAFQFTAEEVEKLAEMEHERWCDERRSMGWTYAPGAKDLARKTSPYLVAWSALTDEVKEYDRASIRQLPAALAHAGLQVCRLGWRA